MAEKETHSERACYVCGKPALVQYDKNGKLFVMCDGRHPANPGCGARVYLGPGNSARLKAATAASDRKGNGNGAVQQVEPANGNRPGDGGAGGGDGTGGGERKRAAGGWNLGDW